MAHTEKKMSKQGPYRTSAEIPHDAAEGVILHTADGTEIPAGADGSHQGRYRRNRVEAVLWDDEHGDPIVHLMMSHSGGMGQGFGGLCMAPDGTAAFLVRCAEVLDLRRTVAADMFKDAAISSAGPNDTKVRRWARDEIARVLVGAVGTSLWCMGENNESMEGIEGPGGRLTLTGFRRRDLGLTDAESALDRATAECEREIAWAERRAAESRTRLAGLRARHVEWMERGRPMTTMPDRSLVRDDGTPSSSQEVTA